MQGDIINTSQNPVDTMNQSRILKFKQKISSNLSHFFYVFKSKGKIFSGVIGSLALIVFLGIGVYLAGNVQRLNSKASGAILSLSSDSANPSVGGTFTVAVAIDTSGLKVSAADIEVKYDPNLLELITWKTGSFLPIILLPASNTSDLLKLTVGSEPSNPKSGIGVLAEATFKVKAIGTANISFGSGAAVAAVGQNSNVATEMKSLQLPLGTIASPISSSTPITGSTTTPVTTSTQTPTPPSTNTATVTSWSSTDNGVACTESDSGKETCTKVIDGVNIFGTGFGTGSVNVKIVDTQGHTYQGTANVSTNNGTDKVWVSKDALKAAGFPYTSNDVGTIVNPPSDFTSWSITVTTN